MKLQDYVIKENMRQMDEVSQRFMAKRILKEVKQIAKDKGITEEAAYELFCKKMQ